MPEREQLPERQDLFVYEHKSSEVNYGGNMRFQQAAFPLGNNEKNHIEVLIFTAVDHFAHLLEDRYGDDDQQVSGRVQGLSEIYLDLWGTIPQVRFYRFEKWFHEDIQPIARVYRKMKLNALEQEKKSRVHNLHYFTSLCITSLIAEMVSDYFEKHIDRLGRLATTARWIIGRALALALLIVEDEPAIKRACDDCHYMQEKEVVSRRLFNPFLLAFSDAADGGLIDEIMLGPNPYKLPPALRKRGQLLFTGVIEKSKRFESIHLKRTLAEPSTYFKLMHNRATKRRIIKGTRKDKLFRTQMIFENVKLALQQCIRRIIEQHEVSQSLMQYACNDKRLSEVILKKPLRKQLLKLIKQVDPKSVAIVKRELNSCTKLINRSKKSWLGRLKSKEIIKALSSFQERYQHYLAHTEDFKLMRTHYGQDSNQGAKWLGLRLWHSFELIFNKHAANDKDRFQFVNIWKKKQVDIENNFAEGNIYLMRSEGLMVAKGNERRQNVIFMFADLRNSTETTMKLTKDTASYLTPYLTAVNTSSGHCSGNRIYFAGDGFAAYFKKIADAIRASYMINLHFSKLRKASSDETIKKAKEIYQEASALVNQLNRPAKVREVLVSQGDYIRDEVKSFLMDIARFNSESLDEALVKKLLAKAASEYSMPRIDAGIALTTGELFNAMIGEDGEDKIPIVISPQLTQAARLSGSSDLVKSYIDTHFKSPFPYSVYAWDRKLYNRGIVITKKVFIELKQEIGVFPLKTHHQPFDQETLFYYEDDHLKRRIILRESAEPVMLKGIDEPCVIYEVVPPAAMLDKLFGKLEEELV